MADSIYKKLLDIQTELKAPKSQFNKFGGYSYRSCEDILERDEIIKLLGQNHLELYIQLAEKEIKKANNEEK